MAKQQVFNYTFVPGYNQTFNAYPNAVTRLQNNKDYIQKMVVAFIANQVANNVSPFVNFSYNSSKCERDTGYLIDAVINDLRFNGNSEVRLISSFYWFNGTPQVDGDRAPEIAAQNYARDLINNYIFTGTAATPAYQTIITQNTTGSNAEAGASTRITSLYSDITSTVSTGGSPALVSPSGYYGTVFIDGNFNIKDLLLITNVDRNSIVFNFADSTRGGTSIYNFNTQQTRYMLYTDTTIMTSLDKLQIFINEDTEFMKPHPTYQDPVEKMRMSQPQAMIDTDFEYSLQGTKWEAVSLVNNIPSVFSKANEPAFTSTQIVSIVPASSGGAAAWSSVTYAPNGTSGLTQVVGPPSGGNGFVYDDFNLQVALPFNVQFLGTTYTSVYVGTNGYITFGGGSSIYFSWAGNFPPFPHILFSPSDRTMMNLYTGTVGSKFIIKVNGGNCCGGAMVYDVEIHFTANSNQIDLHIVQNSFGSVAPAVGDGVNAAWIATAPVNPLTAGAAYRVTTAAGASRDVTVTVNVTPSTAFFIGQPVVFKETANLYLDGSYLIKSVPSSLSFRATMNKSLTAGTDYKSNYTTIYTGGFFTGSEIPITSVQTISGTVDARITFNSPHGLYPGQNLYVVDSSQSAQDYIGSFSVKNIESSTVATYITNSLTNFASTSTVSTGSTRIYVRPTGVAQHRFADGGVQINPGANTPNVQIIRQTRKYFRYQSGKGIQFSTGILFSPTYDVSTVSVTTNVYNAVNNPFYDLNVTTDQVHGFAQPDAYRTGAYILLTGFTVTSGTNYNGLYFISGVASDNQFTVKISPSITDFSPGGDRRIVLVAWQDAVVRDGLFDDQNGIFFEHDGATLAAVKRSSTFTIGGVVAATANSSNITGTGTSFLTQLAVGNYIAIKGSSYLVTSITSNTVMTIQPDFRGATESNLKIQKTIDTRVEQSSFNLDKLDGSGPSGFVFDKSKMQMVFIDYSWYGAGRIRWGMRGLDGSIIYIHQAPQNNINTEAYMRSGNLPGRFEIATVSKLGLLTSALTTSSTSFTMSTIDANKFPRKGRAIINNEVMRYTKGNITGSNTSFTIDQRNEFGLSSNASASIGNSVISYNQNCGPALSHWGVSVIMDGRFDEDKSYLFTASPTNTLTIGPSGELPIISIRLSPSVDNGIGREFGVRNLVNRSALTLKSIGISSTRALQVTCKINCESTLFTNINNWTVVGNGSIAQYLDHPARGTSPFPIAGDTTFSFYAEDGQGRSAITTTSIEIIRELGNSILGGQGIYPDGPDILTVFIRNLDSGQNAVVRARISWTESQG